MSALVSIVDPTNLSEMVKLIETLPQGDIAEIGVFMGGSAVYLYEVAQRQNRKLHLFDTFTGTPVCDPEVDKHRIDAEFAAPSAPANIMRELPEAILHIGIYPKTHPKDLAPLAFVHCDCDQYESYIAVIDHMWPLVVEGGVLLFDDYPYLGGAKKAVEERFYVEDLRTCGWRYYVTKGSARAR